MDDYSKWLIIFPIVSLNLYRFFSAEYFPKKFLYLTNFFNLSHCIDLSRMNWQIIFVTVYTECIHDFSDCYFFYTFLSWIYTNNSVTPARIHLLKNSFVYQCVKQWRLVFYYSYSFIFVHSCFAQNFIPYSVNTIGILITIVLEIFSLSHLYIKAVCLYQFLKWSL